MARNKQAFIRYQIIDRCLQRGRKCTKEELAEAVGRHLEAAQNGPESVSTRTIENDIKIMRLPVPDGCGALIKSDRGNGYYYEDPHFSIANKGLTEKERQSIRNAMRVMRQFKNLPHYAELEKIMLKMEGQMDTERLGRVTIQFESNDQLMGIERLPRLLEAIEERLVLRIHYHPFRDKEASRYVFHPYLLKEYRNRWFVFGHCEQEAKVYCLALDRIKGIEKLEKDYDFYVNPIFDPVHWFKDIIGVTKMEGGTKTKVIFTVTEHIGHYLETKPLHESQQLLEKTAEGWRFSLNVIPNYELASELMRFGKGLQLEQPVGLLGYDL